ncbi:hypothetical protein [Bowmanella denitrificans]|uniref:DUF748 domain-containing protein n=1 Tax=Bowmanella denitrificans TaxID=366582 RepID=UPI000C9BDDED|nr:hypothetical protein [Bowmanella denitrificans]
MKKILVIVLVLLAAFIGVVFYLASGIDELIRSQMETQGSKALQTEVRVSKVELSFAEARMSIGGFNVQNPSGYSNDQAFSLGEVKLDLGTSTQEPYIVEEVLIDAPTVLYEVDASGKANLVVLKDNLQAMLPKGGESQPQQNTGPSPLVSVQKVTIKDAKLRINFEAMDTGELKLDKKQYELTLPTFQSEPVGVPNGLPADQVGGAIMNSMLDNLIKQAKKKVKDIFEDKAKEKAKEKIEEEKQKLEEKAKEKLKNLLGNK